jgi:hypothetical protein
MMRSFRLLGVTTALAISAIAQLGAQPAAGSQQRPDFAGTWVLDTVHSIRDGSLPALTLTVARSGDTLSVLSEGVNAAGSFSTRARYSFDGKPLTNALGGGTLSTTVSWDGATMIVTSSGDASGRQIVIEDRWSLDANGRTLTRHSSLSVNGQRRSETLVFTKRSA